MKNNRQRKEINRAMKYKVIVYYDSMEDSEQVFSNENDAINEMHRLRLKYRNARKYKVEMVECDG
ncbi:MAG: hypothetical protein E7I98_00625 [Streptococcus vestibularis]|nr:hypothetical protein [Streptococcus vestibularis]UVY43946.1 MAG: hypothetical protein [Bacteriophage sp.]